VRFSAVALALLMARTAPPIQLTDVTATSGVAFRHAASKTSVKFLPETMGGGVAIFDADGDGRLDLFFTNGAALSAGTSSNRPPLKTDPRFWNRLYRNLGGWKFEDVTERAGLRGTRYDFGAAAADYDNDGDVDLLVTGLGGTTLYRNDGNGTFTDATTAARAAVSGWSSSAAFVDYDHDGHLDLYVGRYLAWTWESNVECRSTDGTVRAYCHPRQFAPVSSVLLHNNGDGTFTDASASSGIAAHPGKALGVAIEDFDRDGNTDIFVANDSMRQYLFRNTGGRAFVEVALQAGVAYDDDGRSFAGMGVDAGDYDNDGWPDVIVTALSLERYALFRAVGNGRFEYASHAAGIGSASLQSSGWGTKFADFDNDGRRDLFVAQGHVLDTVSRARQGFDYMQPPLMLRNQPSTPATAGSLRSGPSTPETAGSLRSGPSTPATERSLRSGVSFVDVSSSSGPAFTRPAAGRGAAFGDLDDDGDVDIVIANLDNAPTLLRNDGGNGNHWLTVSLHGTGSNRQGIGVIVSVVDEDGSTQSAICSTTSSYQSASDGRIHFGLAGAKTLRRVEVRWPSGAVQVLQEVAADRILEIVEPGPDARQ
jgi:hypothetical protein